MRSIGSFTPENPFFLAPMEAVNCSSFRLLCKKRGAALVYTDMIDADVFCAFVESEGEQKAIDKFINPLNEEYPLAIQIGGAKIETLLKTIEIVESHATLIDFNVGCPLSYMLAKKGGVYLSKHPEQLYKLVKAMREKISIPFTVKIRSGWDEQSVNAVEVAQQLESLGVDAVTLHPRTRKQRYRERADWVLARKVKEALSIPFILSGDVTNSYMAHMAFAHTKCDFIMVARGAKNNPSIFSDLLTYWKTKEQPLKPETTYDKHADAAKEDFRDFVHYYKKYEKRNKFSEIKDHALWTATECRGNKFVTQKILACKQEADLRHLMNSLVF